MTTKITFALFVAALPACYWTAWPAVLTGILFAGMYAEQRFLEHTKSCHSETIKQELQQFRSEIDAINLRMGFKAPLNLK